VQWRSEPAHLCALGDGDCVPRRAGEAKTLPAAASSTLHITSETNARRVIETSLFASIETEESFYASSAPAMR